ncbi:fumarylacetoacetate hydrolase family protein [Ideonella sp. A 288]|uniref:fumarylacetoacetate hydrolase family protein n=1 Tax=Ideonella sp. A 288 TaxID=1962181 RepID=UPI000B4ABDA1|nr:fumarylacetoacetate hydrolase family protein [Ideonella sp. A 288]
MTDIDDAATRLLQARGDGRPRPAPALADADAAYAVQDQVARTLGWYADGPARHWKSGGPSRTAVQTHAPLPPAGVWASPALAGAWPFTLRGIEAEVALRLREPVDAARAAGLDLAAACALIDAMAVSIEVVDSRWAEGLQAPALAKLADLQSHGALVLGAWVPFDVARDWSAQRCRVRLGTQAEQVFVGTHSMADPAFVLPAWLRHATRHGVVLPAGTVITTGTWCGLLHAQAGDRVVVAFDGIGEASVQF